MEFKNEELIGREIEIAGLLMQQYSLNQIVERTGTGKKILTAHIKNMMQKLKAENIESLIQVLSARFNNSYR